MSHWMDSNVAKIVHVGGDGHWAIALQNLGGFKRKIYLTRYGYRPISIMSDHFRPSWTSFLTERVTLRVGQCVNFKEESLAHRPGKKNPETRIWHPSQLWADARDILYGLPALGLTIDITDVMGLYSRLSAQPFSVAELQILASELQHAKRVRLQVGETPDGNRLGLDRNGNLMVTC